MNPLISYAIIALLIVGVLSVIISSYNTLIMLKNNVSKAFFNIDVLLKQRADEIPNLIKVVKESQHYEASTLTKLTQLRTDFLKAEKQEDKIALSNQMDAAVKSIFAVSENYPDLKANSNFTMLQDRVSGIEDAISDRREFFNESINMYNIGIAEFPPILLAKILNYKTQPMLQITDSEKKYDGVKF